MLFAKHVALKRSSPIGDQERLFVLGEFQGAKVARYWVGVRGGKCPSVAFQEKKGRRRLHNNNPPASISMGHPTHMYPAVTRARALGTYRLELILRRMSGHALEKIVLFKV
jgi:hypothetical protein